MTDTDSRKPYWMDDNPPRLTLRTEIIEDNNPYIVAFGWSLSRLLSLLPPTITTDEDEYSEPIDYDLFIYPSMTGKIWNVSYAYTEDGYSDMLYETAQPSIIEAVVQMIETLVSHKCKLNEIEQCHDSSD